MRRYGLMMLVTLAFAACGGGNDGSGGNGGGGGGGGGTTTLDSASAANLAGFYRDGGPDVVDLGALVESTTNPPQKTLPQGCDRAGSWSGNTTDNDSDGVYVQATFQVNCDTTMSGPGYSVHLRVQGSVSTTDNDDSDPWVGRVEFVGLNPGEPFEFFYEGNYGGQTHTTTVRNLGHVETSRSSGAYVITGNYSESVTSTADNEEYTAEVNGTLTFTPSSPGWNPGDPADGTLSANYTLNWSTSGMSALITGLSVSTPTPLTLSASCNRGEPVSGTLRITDGASNVLEITWTGCGQYQATFNGNPIQPAL